MEISTEINKVFGAEMARLFSDQITEEQLREAAEKAWIELNKKDSNFSNNYHGQSVLEREIKNQIFLRFKDEVEKILESESVQVDIEARAKELVKEIRKRAEEKIIERTSNNIAAMYCGYDGYNLRGFIINAVREELG